MAEANVLTRTGGLTKFTCRESLTAEIAAPGNAFAALPRTLEPYLPGGCFHKRRRILPLLFPKLALKHDHRYVKLVVQYVGLLELFSYVLDGYVEVYACMRILDKFCGKHF